MKSPDYPTYQNPVYPYSCPDPYILKHLGEFWGYCTGFWEDGGCFGILHSLDMINWRNLGSALQPLPGDHTCYWAPEVVYFAGHFYLYYSVGDEVNMQIRVAVAEAPGGPFVDRGQCLTHEQFAIDPHVFQDDDGTRYLFYATDFLDHSHIGTGTVVDCLLDPFTLAGDPRPVTRARYQWQIYDPQRVEKGGVCWHTVEGSYVLKHKGRYYHMFSGGNWQNPTYGVSYAVSEGLDRQHEWDQVCDGEQVLPILRSRPDQGIIGPGHNSVVRGPDNRQLFCVYHRWVENGVVGPGQSPAARVMAIDRLEWIGERLEVLGPTNGPEPAPLVPTLALFKGDRQPDPDCLGPAWQCKGGVWVLRNGQAVQENTRPGAQSEARLRLPAASFIVEVSLKTIANHQHFPSAFGLLLDGELDEGLAVTFLPASKLGIAAGLVSTGTGEQYRERTINLPYPFILGTFHLLRLEVNGRLVRLAMDGAPAWQGILELPPARLVLFTRGTAAAFAGFELTAGWEDGFVAPFDQLTELGWQVIEGRPTWEVREQQLWQTDLEGPPAVLARPTAGLDYELVVNLRLEQIGEGGGFGFYPAIVDAGRQRAPLLRLVERQRGWAVRVDESEHEFPLPDGFDPSSYQQFRFWKQGGRLWIHWQAQSLGEIIVPESAGWVGLYAYRAVVAYDLIRFTVITSN